VQRVPFTDELTAGGNGGERMERICAVLIAAAIFTAGAAFAQDASKPTGQPQADSGANLPGLGEIMTLQQLRHIKLWFAGHGGNWLLADYEVGELEEGFDDVTKLLGPGIVDKQVGAPIKALEKAVADKNRAAFDAAFDGLSAGCNSCHRTLDHGFIVIQRPTLLPYSNQNFVPQK
jgi:hypothetical protein